MKKIYGIILGLAFLFSSYYAFAQPASSCPTGFQVYVNNRIPSFNAQGEQVCIVSFDLTFANTFENGTKEIAMFFYPGGSAPTLTSGNWPACDSLGNYLAGASINAASTTPTDMLFNVFTGLDGACPNPEIPTKFQDEGEGVTATLNPQTNMWTVSGLTAQVPQACTDPTLSLDVLFFTRTSNSVNGGMKCSVVTTLALPVTYGGIKAAITDGKLVIDWETETETNNAKFSVLASKNGYAWKEIGTVNSKASDGNSAGKLSYQLAVGLPISFAVVGFALLLFAPLFKSRILRFGILAITIVSIAVACNKSSNEGMDLSKEDTIYIKLAQFDRDGGPAKYSKVIKAIKE